MRTVSMFRLFPTLVCFAAPLGFGQTTQLPKVSPEALQHIGLARSIDGVDSRHEQRIVRDKGDVGELGSRKSEPG
jgi:hypothetical protein